MKKLAFVMALAFSVASVHSFAADKDKGDAMKDMKCKSGKECCKKMSKMTALEKTKCAKACADKKAA